MSRRKGADKSGQEDRVVVDANKKGTTKIVDDSSSTETDDIIKGGSKKSSDNLLQSIRDQVKNLYERMDPIQQKFRFKSRPTTAEIFSKPLVVLLGNHSSGKSSFINYILKQSNPNFEDVQKTGVAPLDDGFTFITYGEHMDEQQGPAIVSNTNLPFNSLKKFGAQFVNHLRLKLCPVPLLKDVILVDSPGMIDSATEGADRGYDFIQAVRWFSERADFVLIMFDPDKPGTTGESLEVFTKALHGIDHKLLILMNKVDKFQNISDFSRAYGALCWNLAKVIPYKDIPYIYTTFVPVERNNGGRNWSLEEFGKSRDEIIDKIIHAPSRHMDNMITELRKYAEELLLHAKIISSARSQVFWYRLQLWIVVLLLTAATAAGLWKYFNGDPLMTAAASLVLLIGFFIASQMVKSREHHVLKHLRAHFEKSHELELLSKDHREELERVYTAVEPSTRERIQGFGLLSFPSLRNHEVVTLEDIIQRNSTQLLTVVHKQLTRAPKPESSTKTSGDTKE